MWHSYHSCLESSCDCERWNVHSLKCADKECSCDKSHLTLSQLTLFPLNWLAVNWVICHGCNQSEQVYWMTTCHDPVTRIIIGVTVVSFYSSVTLPAVFWLVAAVPRDPVHCSHDQPLSTQFRSKWGELRWDLIWTLTALCGCNIFLSRFIVDVEALSGGQIRRWVSRERATALWGVECRGRKIERRVETTWQSTEWWEAPSDKRRNTAEQRSTTDQPAHSDVCIHHLVVWMSRHWGTDPQDQARLNTFESGMPS